MPRRFLVAPLPAAQIDQAFPVVQPLRAGMTPAQWRALAAPFAEAGDARGIVACRMGSGHIRGLFCYALDGTEVLRVGPFAVAGLFDAAATADGLIEAIGQVAQRLRATSIVVDSGAMVATAVPHCDLPELFVHRGYRLSGGALVREPGVCAPAVASA